MAAYVKSTTSLNGKFQLDPESVWVIVLLAALMSFVSISIDLLTPTLPNLTETFDTSANNIKLVIHAFFFGYGVAHLFWGSLSDRFGRRRILLSGILLYCLATLGCIFSSNLGMLILFRLGQGIGGAAGVILARAILRDIYGAERTTRAIAGMMLIFVPIPVITPIIGGYLITHFDWLVIFRVMGICGLLAIFLVTFFLAETAPSKTSGANLSMPGNHGHAAILKHRFFMQNTLTNMFCFSGMLICLTHLSYFLAGNYGFSPQQTGFVIALFDASLAVGVFLVWVTVPRLGVANTIYTGLFLTVFGWIWIMTLYSLSPEFLNLMAVGMICSCIGMGMVMSLTAGQALIPFTVNSGAASSSYGIIQYGGGTIMVVLAGLLQGDSLFFAILLATICAVLSLAGYHVLGARG